MCLENSRLFRSCCVAIYQADIWHKLFKIIVYNADLLLKQVVKIFELIDIHNAAGLSQLHEYASGLEAIFRFETHPVVVSKFPLPHRMFGSVVFDPQIRIFDNCGEQIFSR